MNTLIRLKKIIPLIVITFVLVWFSLSPATQAVVPPPDGGYPGFTTAEGSNALQNLTTGIGNTAAGWHSLFANSVGNLNTAIGAGALLANTGNNNTATGALALLGNTTGIENTANGAFALVSNTGDGNTAIGAYTLNQNTIGILNTAVGDAALFNNTTGGGNIALGQFAGQNVSTANFVTCIGAAGANVDNTTWIRNVFGRTTQSGTTAPVIVSDTGQLGTVTSSARFKKNIASMEKSSEAILALRPVTFHYKTDTKGIPQFGLIAEEVAKVNPALVLPDQEGKPYTVRYEAVNAMLLNEFLKEHRRNEEQEVTIARLEKQLETVTATLRKVSAQLELKEPAPQTVLND